MQKVNQLETISFDSSFTRLAVQSAIANGKEAKFMQIAAVALDAHRIGWDSARKAFVLDLIEAFGAKPSAPNKPATNENLVDIAKALFLRGDCLKAVHNEEFKHLANGKLVAAVLEHVTKALIQSFGTIQKARIELVQGKTLEQVQAEQLAKAEAKKAGTGEASPATEAQEELEAAETPVTVAERVTAIIAEIYLMADQPAGEASAEIRRLFSALDSAELRGMLTAHAEKEAKNPAMKTAMQKVKKAA